MLQLLIMDANSSSNECEALGSSEEPPDTHRNESSARDNAWLHLKTITTFNSGNNSNSFRLLIFLHFILQCKLICL